MKLRIIAGKFKIILIKGKHGHMTTPRQARIKGYGIRLQIGIFCHHFRGRNETAGIVVVAIEILTQLRQLA